MTWTSRAGTTLLLAAALACPRAEQASVEELYTTRMLGLSYLRRNQLPEAEAEDEPEPEAAPEVATAASSRPEGEGA